MWCPECGDEYREAFTVCPDCDATLVATRPAAPLLADAVAHVEYDLRGWSAEQRSTLAQWLQSSRIPTEWEPPATLVVARDHRADVEALVDALSWGAHDEVGIRRPVVVSASPLASPGRRLAGYALDSLLLSLVGGLTAFGWGRGTSTVIVTTLLAACYRIGTVARWGRTLGALAVGVLVIRTDGIAPPGFVTAAIRDAVPVVPTVLLAPFGQTAQLLGIVWLAAVYLPILGPERRGLHDRAAGTIVVRV